MSWDGQPGACSTPIRQQAPCKRQDTPRPMGRWGAMEDLTMVGDAYGTFSSGEYSSSSGGGSTCMPDLGAVAGVQHFMNSIPDSSPTRQRFEDAQQYFQRHDYCSPQSPEYNARWDQMQEMGGQVFPSPPPCTPQCLLPDHGINFDQSSIEYSDYQTGVDTTGGSPYQSCYYEESYPASDQSSSYPRGTAGAEWAGCPENYQSPPDSPASWGVPVTTPRKSPSPRRRRTVPN